MDKRRRSEFPDPGSKKTKFRDSRPQSESDICPVQPTSAPFCNQVGFDVSSSAEAATSQAATVSDNILREHPEFSPIPQRQVPVKSGLDLEKMLNASIASVISSLNCETTPSYTQRGSMVPQLDEKATFSNCDSNCPYQQLADVAKSKLSRILSRLPDCLQVACGTSRANNEVEDNLKNLSLNFIKIIVTSLLDESLLIMPEDACEHFKSASKLYYTFRELAEELEKNAQKFRSALAPSLMSERRRSQRLKTKSTVRKT